MNTFAVYILKCNDGSYYTGHTDNIQQRLTQHVFGKGCGYTASRLPITVMYVEYFATRDEAFIAERKIKGWSRKKKEALIAENWTEVCRLSNFKK